MEKYCISIDWLQTFCHAAPIIEGSYTSRGYNFTVKRENHETAQFKNIFTVYYKSHPAATIQQTPRTSVIHPRATCVKLSNRILYCGQYINILYAIQEALSMNYKGITRLDICYDCNALHDANPDASSANLSATNPYNPVISSATEAHDLPCTEHVVHPP